jgi:hypothetical protein
MADIDDSSLLGDILAASSRPGPAKPEPSAARARLELEDLLRLDDAAWAAFVAAAAPDDLVVACTSGAPAWRERVLACLDQVSADWLASNIAALDEASPALRNEVRERLMATARSLQRDGTLTLPAPLAAAPPPVQAPLQAVANPAPKPAPKPAASARPAVSAPPVVSIGFAAAPAAASTSRPPAAAAVRSAAGAQDEPAQSEADGRLDELFDDLVRLRDQSGTAALAPLANEVSDPFLRRGLSLVAAGLPVAELERALDSELAKQAEAYLDQLMRMRIRLVALANGS